ncbi:ubiquitin-related modifier 1 [Ophiostoma piceae UAMH 11346]|uniref:Ubiquitin-related modifier 1 n=1 Tax=Ophiostoma piceae (strain UAMH 11346) TaxID=1262450 RepID=S3BSL5_OPHP1|nr:ubiquitin-related modifier 1 [Ophiostoma piceae UAMH 11346]
MATVSIVVEFSGGLEMLFANRKRIAVDLPAHDASGTASGTAPGKAATVGSLIEHLCKVEMSDARQDLFIVGGGDYSLRPGILVLINDADWELEGEEAYEIQPRDNILFVSTLHGG